jgi:hypothetical protein
MDAQNTGRLVPKIDLRRSCLLTRFGHVDFVDVFAGE